MDQTATSVVPPTSFAQDQAATAKEAEVIEPTVLKDVTGAVISLPDRLPWGKEKKILGIVGKAFDRVMPAESGEKRTPFEGDDFIAFVETQPNVDKDFIGKLKAVMPQYQLTQTTMGNIDARELLKFFANEAPELITELISTITGQSTEDIDDKFDGQSVLSFAVPYVITAMRKYAGSFSGIGAGV